MIDINPLAFIYHKKLKVNFIYTHNYTYLINKFLEVDIINNEYPYLNNYTTNKIEILQTQISPFEKPQSIDIGAYFKIFSLDKDESNPFNEVIIELVNIKKYSLFDKENEIKIIPSVGVNISIDEFIFDGNELFLFKEIKNIGQFYSFKNKAIKVKFIDRTILKINSDWNFVFILNSKGEKNIFKINLINRENFYFNYIHLAVQFFNFCFMNQNEKKYIEENIKNINRATECSLNQIKFMETILLSERGFTFRSKEENINEYKPTSEDVSNLLKKNEKLLKNLKKI